MGKFILSNDFHSLKIPDQNIRAVLDSQLGGIQDHVVVIHITPHFTGIFIIIVGALRIIFLKHFFCLIMRKTFLLHDTFNTIFLIRAHIHVKYIRLIVLLKRSADEIKKTVIGKDDIIIKILMTACAGGHILLEDIPGVGKTTMAVAFSKALSLKYNRMQFTSDVMPADVTGFYMPNRATGEFDFKPGAVFCNLFLADEINRTSSKTQSALLEAMEEGAVTVDSVTRKLPDPFIVLATQNPSGSAGTQLLPESQLDRFMIRLSMGYPTVGEETEILKAKSSKKAAPRVEPIMTAQDLIEIRSAAEDVFVSDEIYDYIARLSGATRSDRRLELGVSTRGSLAAAAMAKCAAMFKGRNFVIPEDVTFVYTDVCAHRIIPARVKGKLPSDIEVREILCDICRGVTPPKI